MQLKRFIVLVILTWHFVVMLPNKEVNINELKDIFSALQKPKRTHSQAHFFSFQSFLNMLELHGLLPDDPRISDTCALFQSINGSVSERRFFFVLLTFLFIIFKLVILLSAFKFFFYFADSC